MLILPNYCLHSFVWCVWVRTARPCISCLPWLCVLVGLGLCVLVLFSSWGCRVLPFCCCCSLVLALLLPPLLSVLAAWVLALFPGFPPSLPPWLSSGAFWSSQSCWSLPPDIWLYLRRSGCHTFGMACRGDWLVSSLRFMATKASALCGALPSPPCCGCCSCAPRCGAEVFALG